MVGLARPGPRAAPGPPRHAARRTGRGGRSVIATAGNGGAAHSLAGQASGAARQAAQQTRQTLGCAPQGPGMRLSQPAARRARCVLGGRAADGGAMLSFKHIQVSSCGIYVPRLARRLAKSSWGSRAEP